MPQEKERMLGESRLFMNDSQLHINTSNYIGNMIDEENYDAS